MSCTRTTKKELKALIMRLDAVLNDVGGLEEDKREVLEDLALTARDLNDEDNSECECGRPAHECKTWIGEELHGDL